MPDNNKPTNTSGNESTSIFGISSGHSESIGTSIFEQISLPDDYRRLAAYRAAADAKMVELQTTKAVEMKSRWHAEAETLGMTPEEILGTGPKKPRRAGRTKRDE